MGRFGIAGGFWAVPDSSSQIALVVFNDSVMGEPSIASIVR